MLVEIENKTMVSGYEQTVLIPEVNTKLVDTKDVQIGLFEPEGMKAMRAYFQSLRASSRQESKAKQTRKYEEKIANLLKNGFEFSLSSMVKPVKVKALKARRVRLNKIAKKAQRSFGISVWG